MKLTVPAKINLHLRVGPRRADGFHSLLSWMSTIALFDKLEVEPTTVSDDAERVELTCDLPDLAVDQSNLVTRVATAFLQAAADSGSIPRSTGVRVGLMKKIPMGAGLGGGSSDGAHTLLGLNRLFETHWPPDALSAFAARFGSDMPFFIFGPSSVCRGRGEQVTPIDPPQARHAVLLLPKIMMPTPQVYRRFDEMQLGDEQDIQTNTDWSSWTKLAAEELLPQLVNDLEAPAFAISPALGDLRAAAERLAGRPVRMSGSGSSLFTIFDGADEAARSADRIRESLKVDCFAAELAPAIDGDLRSPR